MVKYNEQGFAEFDGETTPEQGFGFGEAIERLKLGGSVCRQGWNGKGMFLALREAEPHTSRLPQIDMATADNKLVAWLASQSDMLATDWMEYVMGATPDSA